MRFILASASPRRKELLEQIGVKFDILPATGEEVITKELPGEVVMELAKQKAEEVAKTAGADALVLGADTVVAYEGKILGKPKDEADALRMLTMLSGKEHEVYTGVALIDNRDQSMENFFERTKVTMYPVSEEEIRDYIAGGEPMDKGGCLCHSRARSKIHSEDRGGLQQCCRTSYRQNLSGNKAKIH